MSKTNRSESAETHPSGSVWVVTSAPVDGVPDRAGSIREKIMSGQAFLKAVEYPWGVEFEVCGVEGKR